MKRRRRFSGDLKAKVALEALRGDRTVLFVKKRRLLPRSSRKLIVLIHLLTFAKVVES